MAVTHLPQGNSKQKVEERIEPCRREGSDAGSCELVQPRKTSDKGGNQDMICGMVKSYRMSRKRKKDDQNSFSDIDDSEVVGYLNTKEEIDYKRVLWEAINRNYTQAKKPRQTSEKKKGASASASASASVKKTAKTTEKVKIPRPSSRVNYDALKLLGNELDQDPETAQIARPDSSYDRTNEELQYGNISRSRCESDEDELDETDYSRYNATSDGHHSYEDYSNDEYFVF